jgi:hypothetical protein
MSERTASELPSSTSKGALVALGPLSRDLIPLLTRWSNDLVARRNISTPLPQTVEQRTARYERDALGEDGVDFSMEAQRETQVEQHTLRDDLWRKPMSPVRGCCCRHA